MFAEIILHRIGVDRAGNRFGIGYTETKKRERERENNATIDFDCRSNYSKTLISPPASSVALIIAAIFSEFVEQ